MPAKIPFLPASSSLQEKLIEASSPQRIRAQLLVFLLILGVGLVRHYIYPHTARARSNRTVHHGHAHQEETIAQVHSILIYPIKSCAAVQLDAAQLGQNGLDLDRRWMVVTRHKRKADGSYEEQHKWAKVALREDPRLTLVVPTVDEANNLLRLRISDHASAASQLGNIETPLRPSQHQLSSWKLLEKVDMWGDYADGRIAESASRPSPLDSSASPTMTPSEWLSTFLGYPVLLLHFDLHSDVRRAAFPIYRPPTDIDAWSTSEKEQLLQPQGLAFADEYPLLVSTVESLKAVQEQIQDAARASLPGGAGGDGRGGRAIGGLNAELWEAKGKLDMIRFRPNIVLCSLSDDAEAYPAFSEDSWDRITILASSADHDSTPTQTALAIVARCQRCLLTAVDPTTAERDASVPLKFLSRTRMRYKKTPNPLGSQLGAVLPGKERKGPCFGVYAIPIPSPRAGDGAPGKGERGQYGEIRRGDAVRVRWRPATLDDEER
ncbi:uncharacterized protein PFL1_03596 [Pseudozyma flocculosa PF-1]|uniref:MOSC domain-containing protein n=2 Tax=Pseudozyma flocculosa TaxID=84751 RepID=A0A5C3F7Y2_9BASI|nr:uncharacterized protein PFL1_03596 [Pseudozyma flocculosa PF-1]EPQ28793.1 hypothetical protein PFL1_03596 [Pseudozyma flocculosa PF-1]SPO39421.1 uncharacterized protein PSFLO_04902 [Pseudozyma flocculosa]